MDRVCKRFMIIPEQLSSQGQYNGHWEGKKIIFRLTGGKNQMTN
jgi:hypothetical protein